MFMKIRSIKALEILDSRGNPTIETTVSLEDGARGVAAVPSGVSTGSHEAVELRDHDDRYHEQGVQKAIANVDKISTKLLGAEAADQEAIDQIMIDLDGTDNKSNLGANAILSVSLAVACAQALSEKKPLFNYLTKFNPQHDGKYHLPIPLMNIMNGGQHANWASDIQEYMILPVGAKDFAEAMRCGAEVYAALKKVLQDEGYETAVGDEGGFAPQVKTNDEPFDLISQAVTAAGYKMGQDVVLGIDAAASEFYEKDKSSYHLRKAGQLTTEELSKFYQGLVAKYPIVSLEDIFAEDDWDGFATWLKKNPHLQLVGDDLYATNLQRLQKGIKQKATNSILVKLNQIGTLSETIAVILAARQAGLTSIISHRSGETEDTFIADLSVAMGTGQIKTGAPARSERTAKYNRLLHIADQLESQATYAVWPFGLSQ
ncbi:MAG: phosphopyruvate hydratase [bacterium]